MSADTPKKSSSISKRITGLLILIFLVARWWSTSGEEDPRDHAGEGSSELASSAASGADVRSSRTESTPEKPDRDDGEANILAAYRSQRSDVIVEGYAPVLRTLRDDEEGSRHQRFILRFPSGHTLLVAHNIDLAPRAPLQPGDVIGFKGEYEWSEEGGVLHWTHHDPAGRHVGGWLELEGRRYE